VDLRDRFRGALVGGAIGDAMGRANEGVSASEARARRIREYQPWAGWRGGPKGTITDDTQQENGSAVRWFEGSAVQVNRTGPAAGEQGRGGAGEQERGAERRFGRSAEQETVDHAKRERRRGGEGQTAFWIALAGRSGYPTTPGMLRGGPVADVAIYPSGPARCERRGSANGVDQSGPENHRDSTPRASTRGETSPGVWLSGARGGARGQRPRPVGGSSTRAGSPGPGRIQAGS